VFFGQLTQDSFRKQIKENRKIEELILMFTTHSTAVLRKEPSLAGDGWKLELNNQIVIFIAILRDCLRGLHHVSPELTARLDQYAEKLAPQQQPAAYSDSGYDTASNRDSIYSLPGMNGPNLNISEMALAQTIASLFQVDHQSAQNEIEQLRRLCDERVSLSAVATFRYLTIFVLIGRCHGF
jgi:hypothetical protein